MTLINYLDYAHVRVFGFSIIRFLSEGGKFAVPLFFAIFFRLCGKIDVDKLILMGRSGIEWEIKFFVRNLNQHFCETKNIMYIMR